MPLPRSPTRFHRTEGKISSDYFERVVRPHLGRRRADVLIGPRTGVDVGVVRLPRAGALLVTTDPLYIEPRLGWERAAWFAFHILASDLTTSGRRPDWFAVDLDVPPETSDAVLATILRVLGREARRLGVATIAGHTGRYAGCAFPIVGSGTLLARAPDDGFVTTRRIARSARLLVVQTAGLEATAMLSVLFPERIRDELGAESLRAARKLVPGMTTVPAALAAASVGLQGDGVWAMHDAAEGGVRAAAWEMAIASRQGLEVNLGLTRVDPVVRHVSDLFGFEPLDASSQGTLLIAAEPDRAEEVLQALRRRNLRAVDVGRFVAPATGIRDRGRRFGPASRDSYWAAVMRSRRAHGRRRPRRRGTSRDEPR